MKTIKFGVFGLGRGKSFFDYIRQNNGEIVAVLEKDQRKINKVKDILSKDCVRYDNFDDFINHAGLDAVLIANYFHEHTKYAIKALEKGVHVLSETTTNSTMAQGVELVRACEKSKAFFMLAENYPYMKFNQEMTRLYKGGTLGQILMAEGEYNHPVDLKDMDSMAYLRPYAKHWRCTLPASYYLTHSLAPLRVMTGSTPKRVSAFPICDGAGGKIKKRSELRFVSEYSVSINIQNDDMSVFRVCGCAGYGGHGNSYRLNCTKGSVENVRGTDGKIMLRYNDWEKPEGAEKNNFYMPEWAEEYKEFAEKAGHDGGDFFVIREFMNCIREGRKPYMDEYFGTTIASVAILAHRSMLNGGQPFEVPDFRNEEDRKKWENDTLTPFYGSEDGSEPTIGCTCDPNNIITQERMDEYDRITAEIMAKWPE